MASSSQITDNLIQKLGSSSIPSLKKALAIVAKLTKRANEADLFREKGGLCKLISLLKRPNNSIIDMAMSALANCAMFEENKKEIRRLDGIQPIVTVLKNLKSLSIQNRAARALANLAENEQNALVIEELGAIEELAKLLNETTDSDCQQTVLRGLKILGTTQGRKKIVYEQGGVKAMAELLKSEKPVIVSCCVKAISEITKNCSKEIAQQIQEFEGIKEIIKLYDSDKSSVSSAAFMAIVNLCVHAHVRVCIGSEGGIAILYKQTQTNSSSHMTLKALEGLCYCCREAVNRNRVLECGGIEVLLKQLSSSEHPSLHRKIITAFNCFYYNEKCLQLLLNNGIVPALLTYLKKVISSCYSITLSEDDNDPYDQESFTSDFSSPSESPRNILFTPLDTNSDISCNESFLEEAENLAIQVRDAKESSRVLSFKRKPRTRSLSSSTPTVKAINQSPSLFSFSSLQSKTETTSMINTCTLSSTSVTSRQTAFHSFPQGLICSTPVTKDNHNKDRLPDELPSDKPVTEDLTSNAVSPSRHYFSFGSPMPSCMATTTDHETISSAADTSKCLESSATNGLEEIISAGKKCPSSEEEDSLGSLPLLTPTKQEKSHVAHQTFHGPGHNAMLLLSRFSHMSDQTGLPYLLTKQCINVLLDYLCLVDNPSPKCARLLNTLTLDPQCFESLVAMGIACDIHRQLCCGYAEGYTYSNGQESHDNDFNSDKNEETIADSMKCERLQESQTFIPHNSIIRCQSIGNKLMENLSCQSQSPFGKGVLMHLLAKGCGEDWLGCVLTLPLICRAENLRNKLMIQKHGLKMLCDLLTSDTSDQVFARVVNSLTVLSSSTGLALNNATMSSYPVERYLDQNKDQNMAQNLAQKGKRRLDINTASEIKAKCPKLDSSSSPRELEHEFCANKNVNSCGYYDNYQGPYDIHLQADSGEVIPAHRKTLINISDMFAAMLSSNYKEGSMPVIPLKQVSSKVLTWVIHHGYGCTLPDPSSQGNTSENSRACKHLQAIFECYDSVSRFQFMIEMLATADRFLMMKLKSITEQVLVTLTTESNITSLCLSAAHYHSKMLCEFGLKFLLLKVPELQQQYNSFREVFKCHDKSKLLDIMYEVISAQLQTKQQ